MAEETDDCMRVYCECESRGRSVFRLTAASGDDGGVRSSAARLLLLGFYHLVNEHGDGSLR